MERFNLLAVPLAGANLLEAAAGTGKTFAIEGLYLRLIIEQALSVGEILVVTYTVAATEELHGGRETFDLLRTYAAQRSVLGASSGAGRHTAAESTRDSIAVANDFNVASSGRGAPAGGIIPARSLRTTFSVCSAF